MDKPLVSILLAVHNGRPQLKDAVRSVMDQTFTDFELLIGFNGCTDGCEMDLEEIIQDYGEQASRIRQFIYPDAGKSGTLNLLLKEARANWIAIQDHDDYWSPDKLKFQMKALEHADHAHTDVLGTWYRCTGNGSDFNQNPPLSHTSIEQKMREGKNCIGNTTALIRRSALEKVNGWRSKWEGIEDFDLWLRMLNSGFKFGNLPYVTVEHTIRTDSHFNSKKFNLEQLLDENQAPQDSPASQG